MLFLYEIRLIDYDELSIKTWIVIISAFVGFVSGVMTIFIARSALNKQNIILETPDLSTNLFYDKGKTVRTLLIIFLIIGTLSALQHWKVLLDEYKSFANIAIEASKIYRERADEELKGVIPYIWLTLYMGVFFSGIYTAYRNKFGLLAFLSLVVVLIKEIANFSRSGMLFSFMEFLISFMLLRHYFSLQRTLPIKKKTAKLVLSFSIIIILIVGGASLVKYLRNPVDEMKGSSLYLEKFRGGFIISPSIYLYASSHVGVLNKHLEEEAQAKLIGSKTISPIYRFLGNFDLVKKPEYHSKGYFIPEWTNTGTYLRDIHGDFSYWGVFTIPFLLGLCTTFYWFRFYERGKLVDYIILTYLYLLIAMSFVVWATSFASWMVVLIVLLFLNPLLEKYVTNKRKISDQ